ncbi:MAG: hypothetical protein AAF551_05640 [Bacteroidota bacterium]
MNHLLSKLFIVFLFSTHATLADQDEKKRIVEKNYSVNSTTQLHITNSFGKVVIDSWDKSEFLIKVEIIGKGNNEDRALRILDAIEVEISESGNTVYCETRIDNNNNKSKNNEGFEINYTVNMPSSNPLFINNRFGDVTMGDRDGDLELKVAYGSYKTGDISGKSEVKLSFGSGSMNDINDGELTIKYSNLDVESATSLDVKQGFSNIEIGQVNDLELESKYGGIEIDKADRNRSGGSFFRS